MAHELGHGLTALLVGGDFESFKMYSDASGEALTMTPSWWQAALVSVGGLLAPALAAAVSFLLQGNLRRQSGI